MSGLHSRPRRNAGCFPTYYERPAGLVTVPAVRILLYSAHDATCCGERARCRPGRRKAMLNLEGHEIGGCKLIRKIGEGGMGEVYLAEQASAGNRLVAVKILRAGDGSAPSGATAQIEERF